MKTAYSFHCFVPFHLADPGGVLFFGNAFTLVHQAFEHFVIHQLKCAWSLWFQNPEWIVPIRHAEAEYLQPIWSGQDCQIDIVISSISHTSLTLTSTIHQNGVCCIIKTVHVFCNRDTKLKMAIPVDLLITLEQHQLPNLS